MQLLEKICGGSRVFKRNKVLRIPQIITHSAHTDDLKSKTAKRALNLTAMPVLRSNKKSAAALQNPKDFDEQPLVIAGKYCADYNMVHASGRQESSIIRGLYLNRAAIRKTLLQRRTSLDKPDLVARTARQKESDICLYRRKADV